MLRKIFVLIFIFFVFSNLIYSEVVNSDRIEFEKEFGSVNNIINLGNNGIVVLNINTKFDKKFKEILTLTKYTVDLLEIWKKEIEITTNSRYLDYDIENNDLVILFNNFFKKNYSFVQIDLDNGNEKIIDNKFKYKGIFKEFKILNNNAYIINLAIKQPTLTIIDLDKKVSNSQKLGSTRTEYKNMTINKKFETLTISYKDEKNKTFNCLVFDKSSKEKNDMKFPQTDKDHVFVTGTLNSINNGKEVLIGTYSNNFFNSAQGVYIAFIDNNNITNIKYHKFEDFNNFFKFLPEKTQENIEKKIVKNKQKNQDYKFRYNFLEHNIIEDKDGFIWLAESYYATYRTEVHTTFVNGRASTQVRSVFDGWVYSHANIAKFDFNGDKLWDNCFGMRDFKTFRLKEMIKADVNENDKVTMLYVFGNNIRSMEIVGGKISQEKELFNLTSFETTQKIVWSESFLEFWYDNYFICYGNQRIADKEDIFKKRKTVYFINKIKFN